MKLAKLTLFLLFALLSVCVATAQYPLIRNFGAGDYNGETQNWDFAESTGHYIFVANGAGLMVFSGTSWDMASVPNHTDVRGVVSGSGGDRYYVGAFEEFGYFENRAPLRDAPYISLARYLPESERQFNWVWSVVELQDGRIVFHCTDRLITYSPTKKKLHVYHIKGKISNISLIGETLYISSNSGIYKMTTGAPVIIKGTHELGSQHIIGAFESNEGDPVFVTRKRGLRKLSSSGAAVAYSLPGLSAETEKAGLSCVVADDRLIVLGTVADGLYLVDRRDGKVMHIDKRAGLRNNSVNNVLIDKDRNLWVALENGLSYVVLDSPFRSLLTDYNEIGTGYASLPYGNILYLGTDQGLYCTNRPNTGSSASVDPKKVGGVSGQIWSLAEVENVILCGANEGSYTVSGNSSVHITGLGPSWGFRPYPGTKGIVIASNYDGFSVLRVGNGNAVLLNHIGGTNEGTANFEIDDDGSLWYSHWLQGIYRFTLSPDLKKVMRVDKFDASNHLPTDENNLVVKVGGKVYVSALNGFFRFNPKNGRFDSVKWLNALFHKDGTVSRLIETPGGNIWGYRPEHLVYAQKQPGGKYEAKTLHYTSTVKNLQMNLGNVSFLSPTETVMNMNDGFYVIDSETPPPSPRDVWIDYVELVNPDSTGGGKYVYRCFDDGRDFRVKEKDASLLFSFSISQYRGFAPVQFSTMIEGYDSDWSQFSPQNYREVSGLRPGRYVMKVRARDSISSRISESSVEFRVEAPWYKRWWAVMIFIIAGLVAVNYLIEYVKRLVMSAIERKRMAEEQKRIERMQHENLIRRSETIAEDNERLNREIKKKSGELVGTDLKRMQASDTLREVTARIKELASSSPGVSSEKLLSSLRSLLRMIKAQEASAGSNVDIENNINIVFDDMLTKLVKKYPKLTRTDIRLCSYLKLNMSSKEIASLMNISERSVESSRYRLRKKLGMESGQSFTEFFTSIDDPKEA